MAVLKNLKRIREIAEGIFTPERVDFNEISPRRFDLTIHFPLLEITNSRRSKHTITDLWVRFPCTLYESASQGSYVMDLRITGRRTKVSLKEFQTGYAHSHLQINESLYRFIAFCLGQSTFGQILDNLKINGTEEDWELMLLSLYNYVSWESVEGGPYINMSSISYQSSMRNNVSRTVTHEDLQQEVFRLMPHLPKEVWEFAPNLRLIENHPELYNFFNTYSRIRRMTVGGRGTGITPEIIADHQRRYRERDGETFIFKGKTIPREIFDESVANIESTTNLIDRQVFTQMVNILESLSTKYLKQYIYDSAKNSMAESYRTLSAF